MTALRLLLIASTIVIYALTALAASSSGFNWPAQAIEDLFAMNWRSQFDFDFIVHLLLVATWIAWREGLTPKGIALGVLSVPMGGLFTFPYLVHATYVAKGDARRFVLGRQPA